MDEKNKSESPRQPKKEFCPCMASGQPCTQDTNPAMMPVETTDAQTVTVLYRRSPPCEHQDISEAALNDQNESYEEGFSSESIAYRRANRDSDGLTDKGQPLVEDQDVEHIFRHLSATTDSSSFLELQYSPRSSQLSSYQSRICPICKLLVNKFSCEFTKQFWNEVDYEGPDDRYSCHVKFFEKFLEKLKDKFQHEEGLKSKNTINLLKYLLKVDPKDPTAGVKFAELMRVVSLFGPVKEENNSCVLIHQLHQIIKRSLKTRDRDKRMKTSWFVGEMNRQEAEDCLLATGCKDKTYLIRISSTDGNDGDFVLSVRHEDHCHHLKIQGTPKEAIAETPYRARLKFAGLEFSSLPDIVDYIERKHDFDIEADDDSEKELPCTSVTCLRVFSNSPLNGYMSGYEISKRDKKT